MTLLLSHREEFAYFRTSVSIMYVKNGFERIKTGAQTLIKAIVILREGGRIYGIKHRDGKEADSKHV